jgi:hypothetical protein
MTKHVITAKELLKQSMPPLNSIKHEDNSVTAASFDQEHRAQSQDIITSRDTDSYHWPDCSSQK